MKCFDQNITLAEVAADEIYWMDLTASDAVNVMDAAVGDDSYQIAVIAVAEIAAVAASPPDWWTHCHQLVSSAQQYVVECDVSVDSVTLDPLRMMSSVVKLLPVEN